MAGVEGLGGSGMEVELAEVSSVGDVDLLGTLILGLRVGLVSLMTRGSRDVGMVSGTVPVVIEGLFVEGFVVD
jgi:hypothetical protein